MATVNRQNSKGKPRVSDGFRLRVKTELLRRDMSVEQLAESLGKSRTAVSLAINHASMFPNVKKMIAAKLGLAA